jgi:hypothetical protein
VKYFFRGWIFSELKRQSRDNLKIGAWWYKSISDPLLTPQRPRRVFFTACQIIESKGYRQVPTNTPALGKVMQETDT